MKAILPLLILALSACAATVNGPVVDGGPIRQDGLAMLGQPTRVGSLVVTPMKLVEDSRCPVNARCVWAGRAVVTTRIDGTGWRETANLELGKPYATHNLSVQLSSVQPEKVAGQQPPAQAYVFGYTGG
ncbi:hypothetical protein [Sphingomonas alba]|uniref:Uncharacterized protein n=1 Tax=Sphingomonas alba TaxID=2908208 RepID=A0ABT0RJQ0_9SPHN|nr:hypothetical protein [Sphingomonas alba]MCL6682825.1 hypothetical protein [Sphingomonas alba]